MWPITQSSPTTVGCSGVVCSTQLSCTEVRSPMVDVPATVPPQDDARPDRALGADAHRADDHGVGVDEGVGVDVGYVVAEGVDGHARDGSGARPLTPGGGRSQVAKLPRGGR